jgi:predicted RNA binding protein YcfA (HicA-like mRNA interferase family)
MSDFPTVSGKKLLKILTNLGFETIRVKGSHYFLKHSDGRCTTIPIHKNENIGIGLLLKILKDCDIIKEEFKKIVKK